MNSRDAILNSIRQALDDVDKSALSEPVMPEIWPVKNLSRQELEAEFSQNLASVAGQAFVCANRTEAAEKIAETLREIASASGKTVPFALGVYPSEQVSEITPDILAHLSGWTLWESPEDPKVDPRQYEPMTASLISPIALLADTGSCVCEGRCAFERFLFYLSPACLVVAKASQIREHLPAAWSEIESRMQNPNQKGEVAIITGPSRTADIEKKLVLGVHGPQKLIVFIIDGE